MIGDKAGGGPHCLPLVVLSGCTRMAEKADELAKLGWKEARAGTHVVLVLLCAHGPWARARQKSLHVDTC
jgi:hypothetical protein